MRVRIERSINSAYMIIEEEQPISVNDSECRFEIQMLKDNEIDGLLSMNITDDGESFVYSIRGCSTLYNKYESRELRSDNLATIIRDLQEGLSTLEEYMIETDHVILDPTYLFMDNTTEALRMCVYPMSKSSLREELKKLAEYLISKTDHNENRAIDLAYGLYRQVMSGDYRFDELLKENEPIEDEIPDFPIADKSEYKDRDTVSKTNAHNNSNIGKTVLFMMIFTIVLFCFALCVLMLYFR